MKKGIIGKKIGMTQIFDEKGNVISWASAGELGFKGSRKSTPFAAGQVAETAAKTAMEHGLKSVEVYVKGPGAGREAAIRALQTAGLELSSIKEIVKDEPIKKASKRKNSKKEEVK